MNAFDAVAETYDRHFSTTSFGARLRREAWDFLHPSLAPGMHALDLGCGTGEDAIHLAAQGLVIHAIDKSPRMVAVARRKAQRWIATGALALEAADLEYWSSPPGRQWDLILANFGVLNCVGDLGSVAGQASQWLKPCGKFFVCVMGRTAPSEWIWFGLKSDFRQSFRRYRRQACVGTTQLTTHYWTAAQLGELFQPWFQLRRLKSLGLLLAPELEPAIARRFPAFCATLLRCESKLSSRPPFNRWGDHLLMEFQKNE